MKYLSLIAPYAIVVSVLCLLGYWGVFGINIFEYADLSDIIKVSVYQLAYYGAFLVISALLTHFYLSDVLEPGSLADTPEAKFLKKYEKFIFSFFIVASLYVALFTSHPSRWFLATCIIMPFVGAFSSRTNFLDQIIPHPMLRATIVTLLIQIPLFSFGWGNLSAVTAKNSSDNEVIINRSESFQYLGVAGSRIFLWDKGSSEVIIRPLEEITEMRFALESEKSFINQLVDPKSNKSSNTDSAKDAAGS